MKQFEFEYFDFFKMYIWMKFIQNVFNVFIFYHYWYFQQTYFDFHDFLYEKIVNNVLISIFKCKYKMFKYFVQIVVNWNEYVFQTKNIFFCFYAIFAFWNFACTMFKFHCNYRKFFYYHYFFSNQICTIAMNYQNES